MEARVSRDSRFGICRNVATQVVSLFGCDHQISIRRQQFRGEAPRHVGADCLRVGIHRIKRARCGVASLNCAEQDSVAIEHDGVRRWRIGRRRRRDVVFGAEAREVVAHEFVDPYAVRMTNPECSQGRREIVDEVPERAYPL